MKQFIASALLLWACGAAALTPVDPYGQLPAIEEAALAPDGTRMAFIHTAGEERSVVVFDLKDHRIVAAARLGTARVRSLEWADDRRLMLTTSTTGMPWGLRGEDTEWLQLAIYDLGTHKIRFLLDHVDDSTRTMNTIVGRPVLRHADKGTVLYLHGIAVTDVTVAALFRVELDSTRERLIRQGTRSTLYWLIDDNGQIAAEESYYEAEKQWQIRIYRDGHPAEAVGDKAPIDAARMLGLSADGQSVVVALLEDDHTVWRTLSRKDASWGAELSPNHLRTRLLLGDGSDRMIGVASERDETNYQFESPELQANWDWVARVLHNERVELVSLSANGRRILVRALGPRSGYAYFLADLDEHVVTNIGDVYANLGPIAEVRKITYAAGDGLKIPAYVTLPPGRPEQKLPLVVLPHGGPQARDQMDFDYFAQAFAARGYVVLQPNYRGSNLSRSWVERGFGEFGRKMQSDLSDGISSLVASGLVDPARVCIVGASYGGYAALAGVTLQTGIYRCAVSLAGISDTDEMLKHVRREEGHGQKIGLRYWERFMGVEGPGDPRLKEISPINHLDRLEVPVLLVHGKEDTTVPFDQSADFAKALKRAHKSVEMVTLDQEDHYLSRPATRLQALRAITAFVEKHNPAD